ncbi:hypothetical protein KDL44_05130 [bacterium]|nr:hypothetical protein [bacterium]
MTPDSVDKLQNELAETVFSYAKDRKKAAGRALGTFVELMTYYTLVTWGLRDSISIENTISEYSNSEIAHNVEFSLHPIIDSEVIPVSLIDRPLSTARILKSVPNELRRKIETDKKNNQLLSKDFVYRNSCVIAESGNTYYQAFLSDFKEMKANLSIVKIYSSPYAIVECKRVGVEEGMKKGPQTIEKAKQGAYVARTVSSLQRFRMPDGTVVGIQANNSGQLVVDNYSNFLDTIIQSNDPFTLENFTLTIGIVSNHGNWFTAENMNKEMRVLAQSYDWLLFLTDEGIGEFIHNLLINPSGDYSIIRDIFRSSYSGKSGNNQFTKVKIGLDAHLQLMRYFDENIAHIYSWYNVIAPRDQDLDKLRADLKALAQKDWRNILQ